VIWILYNIVFEKSRYSDSRTVITVITISVLSNKRGGDPKVISLFYNNFPESSSKSVKVKLFS
jgi:hypothetical protein